MMSIKWNFIPSKNILSRILLTLRICNDNLKSCIWLVIYLIYYVSLSFCTIFCTHFSVYSVPLTFHKIVGVCYRSLYLYILEGASLLVCLSVTAFINLYFSNIFFSGMTVIPQGNLHSICLPYRIAPLRHTFMGYDKALTFSDNWTYWGLPQTKTVTLNKCEAYSLGATL